MLQREGVFMNKLCTNLRKYNKQHIRRALLSIMFIFFTVSTGCSNAKAVFDPVKNEEPSEPAKTIGSINVINDSVVDVFKGPDPSSEMVTQALLCQEVKILEERGGWSKVKVMDGYTGWIISEKIDRNYNNITSSKIIIKSKTKDIYMIINGTSPIKQASMGTEFYCLNKANNWYEVALPMNSKGWIENTDTLQIDTGSNIAQTNGGEFVKTAKKFLDVPYLWGGSGAGGIDCSGLTYICCNVNGVDLPRDAQPQYDAIPVSVKPDKNSMKEGDLIFFSSKINSKDITHVGIYIGNNKFMHASGKAGVVTITSLSEDYYKERIVGVKRPFSKASE